jgi:ABC-2 type transport system permease protein
MTTLIAPTPPARGGRAVRRRPAFAQLLGTELRLFLREPVALFWGVGFPVVLLVVLGIATSSKPQHSLGNVKFIVAYTPVVMVFSLTILALNALPPALAAYRQTGYLRRLQTTPVAAWRLLAVEVVINFGASIVVVAMIAAIARIAFGVPLPSELGGFVLAIVLGAAAMLGLGTVLAALAPTARIAGIAGSLLFFPMMFFAGLWGPQASMSSGLRHASEYTPLGAAVAGIGNAMHGHFPAIAHLAVLVGYAVGFTFAAARLFRWDK